MDGVLLATFGKCVSKESPSVEYTLWKVRLRCLNIGSTDIELISRLTPVDSKPSDAEACPVAQLKANKDRYSTPGEVQHLAVHIPLASKAQAHARILLGHT